MKKEAAETKMFQFRLPKDLWVFLKNETIKKEMPMSELVIRYIEKNRRRVESKLTNEDDNV